MKARRGERGQALAELALLAPLFAVLLLLFSFWARLLLCRLALLQLTRDQAVLLTREGSAWRAEPGQRLEQLRSLARAYPPLDPQALAIELQPLPAPGLQGLGGGLGELLDSGPGRVLRGLLLGKRLTVTYRLRFGGLAGRLFPGGLDLSESAALQGDPWKDPLGALGRSLLGFP